MKKILNLLLITMVLVSTTLGAFALNFEQGFAQVHRKPLVVLIYAKWADNYQSTLQQYRSVRALMSDVYNFVELDLASPDARAYTEKFQINPKLPYIMVFRDGGKISRYLQRDCASSASCVKSKLKTFIQ